MKGVLKHVIKANLRYWDLKIKPLTVKAFAKQRKSKVQEYFVSSFFFFFLSVCVPCSLYSILYSDPLVYLSTKKRMGIIMLPSSDICGWITWKLQGSTRRAVQVQRPDKATGNLIPHLWLWKSICYVHFQMKRRSAILHSAGAFVLQTTCSLFSLRKDGCSILAVRMMELAVVVSSSTRRASVCSGLGLLGTWSTVSRKYK